MDLCVQVCPNFHPSSMIDSESQPETLMPSRQLREALTWKLVSELHRRHPGKFTVIETHPGGGQYDCLSLWQGNQTIADLNRVGGFYSEQRSIPWNELWPICVSDDRQIRNNSQGLSRCHAQLPQAFLNDCLTLIIRNDL